MPAITTTEDPMTDIHDAALRRASGNLWPPPRKDWDGLSEGSAIVPVRIGNAFYSGVDSPLERRRNKDLLQPAEQAEPRRPG